MINIIKKLKTNNNDSKVQTAATQEKNNAIDAKFIDTKKDSFIGSVFGDFVVKEKVGKNKSRHNLWLCECQICGETFTATSYDLIHHRRNTRCKTKKTGKPTSTTKVPDNKTKEKKFEPITTEAGSSILSYDENYVPQEADKKTSETDKSYPYRFTDSLEKSFLKNENNEELITCYNMEKTLKMGYRDINYNLFNMPVFYYCVGMAPANMITDPSSISNKFCSAFSFSNKTLYPLNAYWSANAFLLTPTAKEREEITLENLRSCISKLVSLCYELEVHFLAVPHIGCGKGRLNWTDVKKIFLDEFSKVYLDSQSSQWIRISFVSIN